MKLILNPPKNEGGRSGFHTEGRGGEYSKHWGFLKQNTL